MTNNEQNLTHRFPRLFCCTITSAMVHNVYFIPRCPFHFSRLICNNIHCVFFTRQIWQQNYRPATTTTKTKQKQHRVRNHVAKENNITKAITKNNITNIITNNIAKYSKQWQTTNNYKRGTLRITNNKKQQQKQTKECHRDLKAGGTLGGRAQRLPPKACSPGCFHHHHHHHHQQHNNSQQQEEDAKITLSQRKPKARISI